jgi:hypothetical protein
MSQRQRRWKTGGPGEADHAGTPKVLMFPVEEI